MASLEEEIEETIKFIMENKALAVSIFIVILFMFILAIIWFEFAFTW